MPIKFRCQHCRQFLGISRSKAGQPVDCPTCGRTVRVPNLDGSIEPIPEPKLDVNELAGALNELARIGEEESDHEPESEAAPETLPPNVKALAPLPKPEPISLAPPPKAVVVDFQADKSATGKKTADPLAELAANKPDTAEQPHRSASGTSRSPFANPVVLGALLAALIVGGLSGWMLGGKSGGDDPAPPSENDNSGASTGGSAPAVKIPAVYQPENWKPALKGQVTYHGLDGRGRPDAGARILVLPETRKGGQSKLATAGFWANADEADFRVAVAGLRELGGNATLADAEGRFEVSLPPTAGTFQILLISHYKGREPGDVIGRDTKALAENYFDRPDALIKQLAFKQHKVRFDGSAAETWNHTFE